MAVRKGNLIPLSLIGGGLLMLIGCIYIPYIGSPRSATSQQNDDIELLGGTATPKLYQGQYLHKFKIGVSTRADVLRELPLPAFGSDDPHALSYFQQRAKGYLAYPLCFFLGGNPDVEIYFVRLHFDSRGVLTSSSRNDAP